MNHDAILSQFPILTKNINGKPLVYLDNAASSQKPERVIEAINNYYQKFNANVHRGVHTLSREATELMEESRKSVQKFVNAKNEYEVIFTKGTTDAVNLAAFGLENLLKKGDEIIVSELEHHSNLVPWQMLAQRCGATIKLLTLDENLDLDLQVFKNLLNEKTKIVAVNHISNALGIINPIEEIIRLSHQNETIVFIDGAQSVPHTAIDVQVLDADFFCFSGHKMYAPTGVGILYGKEKWLEQMRPYQGGGEMINEVFFDHSTYASLPFKFEAGTPNIEANIVLKEAIGFMNEIGIENIKRYENELLEYTTQKLLEIPELILYGTKAKRRAGAISFNVNLQGVHSADIGLILDKYGVAVRTGHHCTQLIMKHLQINGTIRASFGVYNTKQDIDILVDSLKKAIMMLA